MGLALKTVSYFDNSAGVDLKSSPTKVAEENASSTLNVDYSIDGAVFTRNGSNIVNVSAGIPAQIAGAPKSLAGYDFHHSNGTIVQIWCAGTAIYHDLITPVAQVTGLTANLVPDFEPIVTGDNDYVLFGNGTDTNRKFNGTTWTNLSLPRPAAPPVVDFAVGLLAAGTYEFYFSYAVTVATVIVQEGELSPVGSVAIGALRQIRVPLTVSTDAQVNARVVYQKNNTTGFIVRIATVLDNVTLFFDANVADANLGAIEADFTRQAAPTSAIIEANDYGQVFYVDAANPASVYPSTAYLPWNVPTTGEIIFDGPVKCIKRCYGAMLFATDKSLWVQDGDSTAATRRISSSIGIVNNRCAVGEKMIYILATNKKFYSISPTDFSQEQMRLSEPLSDKIDPVISALGGAQDDQICMSYYSKAGIAKVIISVAYSATTNDTLLIFNEEQSLVKKVPVWQIWNNINANALSLFNVTGNVNLYSGDYNGFIWKLDDSSLNGDGTEQNGTVTSATATVITDTTQTWTVNAFVGMQVRITAGTGIDEVKTITSNTATTLTTSAWTATLDTTSEFTVGGYDSYHFTNWKYVTGSYDILKQLWFIWSNLNASGDYNVKMILQYDFDTTITNQTELLVNLRSANTIWDAFLWGYANWGARSVFEDRIREYSRFKAIRIGFYNRSAGQPFQVNGFSISAQEKGLFFRV